MRDSTLRPMLRQLTQSEQTFATMIFLPITKIITFSFNHRLYCGFTGRYTHILASVFLQLGFDDDNITSTMSSHMQL